MKSVPVVSSELGVNTLERRVPRSLRLLDSVEILLSAQRIESNTHRIDVPVSVRLGALVVLRTVLGLWTRRKRSAPKNYTLWDRDGASV